MLAIEYHVHIWQVLPQLSCGDTCQIYECDSKNITGTFARLKILLKEKFSNVAFATPTQVIESFHVFIVASLNRLLDKQSNCWWSQTPWRSCDITLMFSGWPSEECTNLDVREAHPPNDPYCWWRRASNSSSITAVSATTASATTTAAAVVARFWHRQQAGDSDIGWNHGMVTAMNDMDQYIGPVEKHGQCLC